MGVELRIALVVMTIILGAAALASDARAFGENGGTETGSVTIPAGGTGGISTDALPPKVTQGTIEMQAQESADSSALIDVAFFLAEIPTPGRRLVACAMMTYGKHPFKEVVELTQNDPSLQLVFFAICAHIALALTPASTAATVAQTATPACSTQRTAVPITITRTSSGYQGQVNGSTFTPRTRSKAIVSCRSKGRGLLITVKPRRRHQTLRQAVGPTLGLGFANSSNRPIGIRTTFKVK